MKFKKFLSILITLLILINLFIAFEPLLLLNYERSGEKNSPFSNGAYFEYSSSLSEINYVQNGVPTVSPVSLIFNLSVHGKIVTCRLSADAPNLENVSKLGYHPFFNRTRTFSIHSSFIRNFLLNNSNITNSNCFQVNNQTLGYISSSEYCGNFGTNYNSHACVLEVKCYGFEGNGFVGGPKFNTICYAKSDGVNIFMGATIFNGNPSFLFEMLNGTTFTNDTIKGVSTASISLEKTNVQLNPLFYTFYLIQNFFFNLIFTIILSAYIIAVYTVVRRKRKRGQ